METRTILIKILTQLQKQGVEAAKTSMRTLAAESEKVAKSIQKGLSASQVRKFQSRVDKAVLQETKQQIADRKRLISLSNRLDKALQKEASTASKTAGIFGKLSDVFRKVGGSAGLIQSGLNKVRSGLNRVGSFVRSAATGFGLFNSIFGQLTIAMLAWQAWRVIVNGFKSIVNVIVSGNAQMQTAMATFTTLTGGSVDMANTFIDTLKQLSVQTGASFGDLLAGAKRFPSIIGENVKAFEDLTKTAIVLSRIDPVQGLEGAFFALTNAMEGTAAGARSLVQRFELGTIKQFRAAMEETGNAVEAVSLLLQRQGIDVDQFLKDTENTLPIVVSGIKAMADEFLRLAGESTISAITEDLANLRNWLRDNQAAIQGLALAIGDKLVAAFSLLKTFIAEVILGGKEITAGNIFETLLDGAAAFAEFLANALVQILNFMSGVANAIASIVNAIFGLFGGGDVGGTQAISDVGKAAQQSTQDTMKFAESVEDSAEAVKDLSEAGKALDKKGLQISPETALSQLSQIGKQGKETIELMVNDILDAVTGADLEKIGASILQNIINLEAQEVAQEKSIDNIEKWVKDAEREVSAARDKLKLFDLATADIPERFTRARKRQLETEIFRAEKEAERRKEGLEAAKAQLEVTKEQLKLQRDILSLIESRDEAAGGIDKSFQPGTIDTGQFKSDVEDFRAQFADRLEPSIERIKESFAEIGQFVRGFVGADPAGQISEMFEKGQQLKDAISSIGSKLSEIAAGAGEIFTKIQEKWDMLPDPLKKILVGVLITGLLPGGGTIITLGLNLAFKLAGFALSAASPIVKWLAVGAAGTISLPAVALVGATLVLAAQIWFGREELSKWISGERLHELGVILKVAGTEALNAILGLFGAEPIPVEIDGKQVETDAINLMDEIGGALSGQADAIGEAAKKGIWDPIIGWFTDVEDEAVGNSIFPDMMTKVVELFLLLPSQLANPLQALREGILGEMGMIRNQWVTDWMLMASTAQQAIQFMNLARETAMNMGSTLAGLGLNQTINQFGDKGPKQLDLKLDANETRKLMEEGTYRGFEELFG